MLDRPYHPHKFSEAPSCCRLMRPGLLGAFRVPLLKGILSPAVIICQLKIPQQSPLCVILAFFDAIYALCYVLGTISSCNRAGLPVFSMKSNPQNSIINLRLRVLSRMCRIDSVLIMSQSGLSSHWIQPRRSRV